jgi:hypothetical protein
MSFNDLFGNQSHTHHKILKDPTQANLGVKLNKVRDRIHTQKEIPIFDVGNSVIYQPVSTYGASLLDTTSLADLRATILENTNEEAIRLLADGNNEINFYTGGTGASNLKLQIKDATIEVKNNAAITCFDLTVDPNRSFLASYVGSNTGLDFNLRRGASVYQQFDANGININENVVFAANKHLKQTVNDSGDRVLFESATGKNQYCLYSYEAGTNSGLLIQATGSDVMEINNFKNNVGYQPISINRSAGGYLVVGDSVNNSGITANFIANGTSVFTNGASPQLQLSSTNIQPYKNIIPNADGTLDIGFKDSGPSDKFFSNIYGNNLWGKTALHTASIRPYTNGNPIHFHNTSLTFDNTQSISVDNLFSSATNRDLYLGNGPSDIKMRFINGAGGEIQPYTSIVPPNADGLLNLGSPSKFFGNVYATSVYSSIVTGNDLEANVSIKAVGNNAYLSAEDDNTLNGKVQIISENSSTYTGYVSFLKNDTRQMFLGFDNALQFENGSNFTIRSDAQTYLSFIHDANFANRKINVNVDLIPTTNAYDLGSFTNRFVQIHGTTINAFSAVSTDLITPYAGGNSTAVQIDGDFLPINPNGGGSGTRKLGNGANLWDEVYATNTQIQTSDKNMKKDIQPITNALQFVRKLKPVQYKWKKNSHGRTHTGFISQDVLQANPLGLGDNWSGYVDTGHGLGLRYGEFISVNTQAIKELDSKVSRLVSGLSSDTKVDLNYHTDSSELVERIEALEIYNRLEENGTIVEEYDDSELKEELKLLKTEIIDLKIENKKQEDVITQLIADNMNLSKKLEMLMEQFSKFVNDKPNVELKIEEEQLLSDTGDLDMMENVQERLHIVEQKVTKLTNKQSKLVTAVNKLKK